MDIPKLSMNTAQNNVMTAVNTELLSMSLDAVKESGDKMCQMIQEAGAQIMNADHIDVRV